MSSVLHVLAALRALPPDERARVEALVARPAQPAPSAPVQPRDRRVYTEHPAPGRLAYRKIGERWIECEPVVTPLARGRRPVEVEGSQPGQPGGYNPVG